MSTVDAEIHPHDGVVILRREPQRAFSDREPARGSVERDHSVHVVGAGVDAIEPPLVEVADPHEPAGDDHVVRIAAQRDERGHAIEARVDPGDHG